MLVGILRMADSLPDTRKPRHVFGVSRARTDVSIRISVIGAAVFQWLTQHQAAIERDFIQDAMEALAVFVGSGRANFHPDTALVAVLASVGVFDVVCNIGRRVLHKGKDKLYIFSAYTIARCCQ